MEVVKFDYNQMFKLKTKFKYKKIKLFNNKIKLFNNKIKQNKFKKILFMMIIFKWKLKKMLEFQI